MKIFDSETKTWFGQNVVRNESSVSFLEIILQSFRLNPEKVFQISDDEGTSLTFAEVEQLSIRVAQNLHRLGVRGGDVVSLLLKNSTFTAPIVFGCFLVGAIVNPFFCFKGTELWWIKEVLNASKPKMIVMEDPGDSIDLINQALKELELEPKMFLVGEASQSQNISNVSELLKETGIEKDFKLPEEDEVNDDSIFLIIPSSGTTAAPKAIGISGRSLKLYKFIWKHREDVVMFTYSTISWVTGIMALLFPLLNSQLRIITKAAFSPRHLGYIVKKYSVTTVINSTTNTTLMLNSPDCNENDFLSMKEFLCGGERVPKLVSDFVKSKLPKGAFSPVYGASELGAITLPLGNVDISKIIDNVVGYLHENGESRIVDIESRKALGPNENGEILIRSPTIFSKYVGKPDMTKKAFEEGGWFKTGDFGYFDEMGLLHVHGRISHMISVGGKNVHPAPIEQFFESFEGVREACTVSITNKNVLSVLITLTPNSQVTEDFLSLKASEHFEDIRFDGGIHIVDVIPRTRTMSPKINRGDAEKLATNLLENFIPTIVF